MPFPLKTIGVVFGGESGEHYVSINSAATVIKALRSEKNSTLFKTIPFYIDQKGRWLPPSTSEKVLKCIPPIQEESLPQQIGPKGFRGLPSGSDEVDIWYPVLHGPNGEDGTVQGLFKLMGKPFVGSGVLGSAIGMDKIAMKAAFSAAGLNQVPFLSLDTSELIVSASRKALIDKIQSQLLYPCFIKPANLGSSVGITKATDRQELIEGLYKAATLDKRIVIEKSVKGRELECAVLGGKEIKSSVVGEVIFDSEWYDYETKYSDGSSQMIIPATLPVKVSEAIQNLSLQAFKSIAAIGMARVDFFYVEEKDELFINEINTLPGFTSQSMYPKLWEASNLPLEKLVAKLVDIATE